MNKSSRVKLITALAEQFEKESWDSTRITLKTFGLNELEDNGFEPYGVTDSLSDASDEDLVELAEHFGISVQGGAEVALAQPEEYVPRKLSLFASHLTTNKKSVHSVCDYLKIFGIDTFVAHDDINPNSVWQEEIKARLRNSDLGLVFYAPKFEESVWCQQEVGWLLGRGVPMVSLMLEGVAPMGFANSHQGLKITRDLKGEIHPPSTALAIVKTYSQMDSLSARIVESVIFGLAKSASFDTTRMLYGLLMELSAVPSSSSIEMLRNAIKANSQVFNCQYYDKNVSDLLGAKIAEWEALR